MEPITKADIRSTVMQREWQDVLVEALAAGWTVTRTGKTLTAVDPLGLHAIRIQDKASGFVDQKLVRKYRRWIAETKTTRSAVAIGTGDIDPVLDGVLAAGLARHAAEEAALAPDPEVTSLRPWLAAKYARKDGGRRYESEAVLERRWSDGTVDYVCAYEGCDYVAVAPRSVSSHYRSHVRKGEAEPVTHNPPVAAIDPEYTEPMARRDYHPTDRLLTALAAFLSDSFDDLAIMPAHDIAFAALRWFHERPDLDDVDRPGSGTRTPEQIIERIRALVGGRDLETERLLEETRSDLAAALLRVEELEADLTTARSERDRARSDLTTFVELAETLRPKEA